MPTHSSFDSLQKVTRLYLSGKRESVSRNGSPKCTEAVVWLASGDRKFNRAFVSTGLAESFSGIGLNVTLIEASSSLPNIGYYFSLEPEDYLLGTIEGTHFFVGNWSGKLQYAFGTDISGCFRCIDRFVPQEFPHLVLLSFPIPSDGNTRGLIFELRRVGRALLRGDKEDTLGIPDLIFVACEHEEDETAAEFIETVRTTFQKPLINRAVLSPNAEELITSDRSIHLPPGLFYGSYRRVPPRSREFDEMATSMLEFISTRRKRAKHERAGG